MDEHKRTGPVVLRAGTTVRRVDVWAGTRTQTSERLMTGRPFPSETHYLTPERTRWQPAFDLPIGEVVTTARGREPAEGTLFLVGPAGLEPLGYDAAWDRVYPAGAAEGHTGCATGSTGLGQAPTSQSVAPLGMRSIGGRPRPRLRHSGAEAFERAWCLSSGRGTVQAEGTAWCRSPARDTW